MSVDLTQISSAAIEAFVRAAFPARLVVLTEDTHTTYGSPKKFSACVYIDSKPFAPWSMGNMDQRTSAHQAWINAFNKVYSIERK